MAVRREAVTQPSGDLQYPVGHLPEPEAIDGRGDAGGDDTVPDRQLRIRER